MSELEERLAVVEDRVEMHDKWEHEEREKDDQRHKDLTARLDAIERELSRYRGFVGGVVFIAGCLFTFLTQAPDLLRRFK